jgi:hypothetical protein
VILDWVLSFADHRGSSQMKFTTQARNSALRHDAAVRHRDARTHQEVRLARAEHGGPEVASQVNVGRVGVGRHHLLVKYVG